MLGTPFGFSDSFPSVGLHEKGSQNFLGCPSEACKATYLKVRFLHQLAKDPDALFYAPLKSCVFEFVQAFLELCNLCFKSLGNDIVIFAAHLNFGAKAITN